MPLAPIDLLRTLAEGIDFRTGEPFQPDHVLNDPQAIRALHWVLEQRASLKDELKEARPKLPHQGEAWTEQEDALLRSSFEQEMTIANIVKAHGRTRGAISSRLKKLGLIA